MLKSSLFILTIFCLFTSCYFDKKELVYPLTTTCDTINIKFSSAILPILNTACNNCHGGNATTGGNIVLDNYNSIKIYINNGRCLNSVLQNGLASPMPKGAPKLSDCNINKLKAWINAGALNN